MECLRAEYTEVWVRSEIAPLIRFADCVRSIASTGLDQLGVSGVEPSPLLLDRLRSFDAIDSWYGSNRPEFREQLRRLGVPVRFFDALPPADAKIHAADFFLKQAGAEGQAIPRILCPPVPVEDFAVIHPFSGSPRKNWPLDQYRELARQMPMPVRWCAGPEEPLQDAVRIENLYELACWVRRARLYVGNDSGITHLAAAAGTPVVAIFGPTNPVVWAPRGKRVRIVAGKLEDISVGQVLDVCIDVTS